jgi:hypothetical protein
LQKPAAVLRLLPVFSSRLLRAKQGVQDLLLRRSQRGS